MRFCLWMILLAACTPSGGADWATVRHVNDGDTVLLTDGRRVRYIGVDTPEIDHDGGRAEPFGYAAREANRKMVGTRNIRLVTDREARDRYGRLLAYVYLPDGQMVNVELLQRGLAVVLFKRPNVSRFSELLAAQREAMSARRGLWQMAEAEAGQVVGNRNSMRFHLPTCPAVRQIRPANRVAYPKKWDAYWDGYSPARDCIPKGNP
jgi:endonuclease YncB( thermonuclease family)